MRTIRTLIRANRYGLVVPAWAHDITLPLEGRTDVPQEVLELIEDGKVYFHAHVNIGAELPSQIVFSNWEDYDSTRQYEDDDDSDPGFDGFCQEQCEL